MSHRLPAELDSAGRIEVGRGEPVFRQGETCQNYYIATSGCIKVFARSAAGKEIMLYRVVPGDICVLTTSCILSGSRYPADAVAESATTVIALPKREFDQLMHNSDAFRKFVLSSFGSRLSGLVTLVEQVALESVQARLANLLLAKTGDHVGDLKATHQDLATEIGTAREVVSRQLKAFASLGLLSIGRGTITILDRRGLEALSSG